MNPPESAAGGSEARNRNTPHCDGTGAVPADRSMGMEVQAAQPSAAPTECNCAAKTCMPQNNVGHYCWRSGITIRVEDL